MTDKKNTISYSISEIADELDISTRTIWFYEEKSLAFGNTKIKEIQERRKELSLIEQDILATREKLIHRITRLKQSNNLNSKGD